jgi:pyrimidine-nucleoside phosphorylase
MARLWQLRKSRHLGILHRKFSTINEPIELNAVEIINKKREGFELTKHELNWFVKGFHEGDIEHYQASAWLMAVCLKGMTAQETAWFTGAMKSSGMVADLSDIPGPKVDKHSTGGVGDKISLVLAPLVASCGLTVPMMSGRGLGHTGGTLDKLESIPGFNVDLSMTEFKDVLRECGVAIIAPSSEMAPADRKMYALRDVTATVRSIPLQTASIMCKKLAENPDSLVLDVKTGRGAFNPELQESIELASSMIAAGESDGKQTTAFVTSMEQPIGRAVGNWFEVRETIETLAGGGPADLRTLTLVQAGQMLLQGRKASSLSEGIELAACQLDNGQALTKFHEMVAKQGGDVSVVTTDALENYPEATTSRDILASTDGVVDKINAMEIGMVACNLGAGRMRIEDEIDFTAGIMLHKKVGDKVVKGDVICTLYTNR